MARPNETGNPASIAVVGATIGSRIKHFLLVMLALVGAGAAGGSFYFFFGGYSRSVAPQASRIRPAVLVDRPTMLVNLSTNGGDRPQER